MSAIDKILWRIKNHLFMPLMILLLGLVLGPFLILVWAIAIVWCVFEGWEHITDRKVKSDD